MIAGMSAGAFGQFIASPTDLVKVQMQMEGKRVILEGRRPRCVPVNQVTLVFFVRKHVRTLDLCLPVYLHPVKPLTPKSDWHLISPYNITTESHINVMKLREMIMN